MRERFASAHPTSEPRSTEAVLGSAPSEHGVSLAKDVKEYERSYTPGCVAESLY